MHEAEAAYLRYLGDRFETLELDGVYAVKSGLSSNTENGAVSAGPVGAETAGAVLDWLGGVPASWIAFDPSAGEVLVAAGCTPEADAWQMEAPLDALDLSATPHEVESGTVLERWLDVHTQCDWFDDVDAARRVYGALQGDRFRLYVCDGGAASAFFMETTVLLTSVAVVPDARRRGIGRALAVARLREARERGCTTALLAPSPDGAKLYASLGFALGRQPAGHWFYCPTR
jgi:GNAT superfamily N-acetyltransferase